MNLATVNDPNIMAAIETVQADYRANIKRIILTGKPKPESAQAKKASRLLRNTIREYLEGKSYNG